MAKGMAKELTDILIEGFEMLCQNAMLASNLVWTTITASANHGCHIGEESITDFLVLGLALASAGSYTVRSFNRRQEAINGSDWELWLTGPTAKWFGMRVQAKIIGYQKCEYPHLHPRVRPNQKSQVQKLIDGAAAVSAMPVYCLYTAWPTATRSLPKHKCARYPMANTLFGISVVPANKISKSRKLSTLSPHMTPFHCLFCSCGDTTKDLPETASLYAEGAGYESRLLDSAPKHVSKLLANSRELGSQEAFLDKRTEDLSRVVVISQNHYPAESSPAKV